MLQIRPVFDLAFMLNQKEKIQSAAGLVNTALLDKDFQNLITKQSFTQTDLTASQVLMRLLESGDVVVKVKLWVIPWYKRWTSAVAYESAGAIHLRDSYLDSCDEITLANTLIHEAMHTLGFKHDFWNTVRRIRSVPYLIGNVLESFLRGK